MLASAGQMLVALVIWWLTSAAGCPWRRRGPAREHVGGSVLWPLLAVLALGVCRHRHRDVLPVRRRARGRPTVGASVTYLIPVVSVALGVLVLGERLQWPQFAGAAVVLGAASADRAFQRR
jgi:hypothetical protein